MPRGASSIGPYLHANSVYLTVQGLVLLELFGGLLRGALGKASDPHHCTHHPIFTNQSSGSVFPQCGQCISDGGSSFPSRKFHHSHPLPPTATLEPPTLPPKSLLTISSTSSLPPASNRFQFVGRPKEGSCPVSHYPPPQPYFYPSPPGWQVGWLAGSLTCRNIKNHRFDRFLSPNTPIEPACESG